MAGCPPNSRPGIHRSNRKTCAFTHVRCPSFLKQISTIKRRHGLATTKSAKSSFLVNQSHSTRMAAKCYQFHPVGVQVGEFELSRVKERRVAGRGPVAHPALSLRARNPKPVGTFPLPALRTRRADFRHRALQWNHAARTRASRTRPAGGSGRPGHPARTLALAGRYAVRPVDALTTATTRVVPFAWACNDCRHSCSSPG